MTAASKMYWISWEQHGDAEHDPDCRPVAWPPPPEVLAFWESGFGGGDGADAFCAVVALVRSKNKAAAKATIEAAWSPGIGAWRFNREYDSSHAPGDRFPAPRWSIEMGRWPWQPPDGYISKGFRRKDKESS
jgi:hypothetical protein